MWSASCISRVTGDEGHSYPHQAFVCCAKAAPFVREDGGAFTFLSAVSSHPRQSQGRYR